MPKRNKQSGGPKRKRYRPESRGPPNWGPSMAPAAVSTNRTQSVRFSAGSRPGDLRMKTTAAIARVLKETVGTDQGSILLTTFRGTSVELNLTHPLLLNAAGTANLDGFITPIYDLIASAFVRYRLRSLKFHYEPQASSTDSQQMVFAFAADPVHPVLWNSTPPDANDLLALSDSRAFMPWEPWTMDLTDRIDTKTVMYTYSDPATTVGTFSERFSDFGVMSCVGATPSQAANLAGGVLYMETDIELMEFCPISVTRPAAAKHLSFKLNERVKRTSGKPVVASSSSTTAETTMIDDAFDTTCKSCEVLSQLDGYGRIICPQCLECVKT